MPFWKGLGIDPALRFCYPTSQKMFWEEKAGPGGEIYFLGPPCLVRGLKRKLLTKPIVLEAVLERKLLTKSIVFRSLGVGSDGGGVEQNMFPRVIPAVWFVGLVSPGKDKMPAKFSEEPKIDISKGKTLGKQKKI